MQLSLVLGDEACACDLAATRALRCVAPLTPFAPGAMPRCFGLDRAVAKVRARRRGLPEGGRRAPRSGAAPPGGRTLSLHNLGCRKCKIPREPLAPRRRASFKPQRALGHSGMLAAASLKPSVKTFLPDGK